MIFGIRINQLILFCLIGNVSLYKKSLNIISLLSFVKMLPHGFLAIKISHKFGSIRSAQNALSLC